MQAEFIPALIKICDDESFSMYHFVNSLTILKLLTVFNGDIFFNKPSKFLG